MRSPDLGLLLRKDARLMLASRAWWLLTAGAGLLTGHAFLTAVSAYAEMSGTGGGPAALREGLSPLDGIVVPTMSVLSLVATLLLPFVVIRMFAHERATGAWKLLVQGPAPVRRLALSKVIVLHLGWAAAWVPAAMALLLWRAGGNHLNASEVAAVAIGHALFAWLTIGVAAAVAVLSASEAGAAILTLGFTIGTWALDFVGAARGGMMARVARYSPTAALGQFERGLFRADAAVVMLVTGATGIAIALAWMSPGRRRSVSVRATAVVAAVACTLVLPATTLRFSRDLSENRRNSFSSEDERALASIRAPLRIEVHLAPEDPRRFDLQTNVIDKLTRTLQSVTVVYSGGSGTGMFAAPGQGYGEMWYDLGGRREMTHSTAEPIVLEMLYHLANIEAPAHGPGDYPGYPLVRRPAYAALMFYLLWPAGIAALWIVRRMRQRRPFA